MGDLNVPCSSSRVYVRNAGWNDLETSDKQFPPNTLVVYVSTEAYVTYLYDDDKKLPHPKNYITWLAGKSTMNEDVFPIESGDFPMSC